MATEARSRAWPGRPSPLGASWDGEGVNFALYSAHATAVTLCLFDGPEARTESEAIPLDERTGPVWHVYLPDARPGQLYGWRVDGPWAPHEGHRFNRHKLLLDPWTRAVSGTLRWDDAVHAHDPAHPDADLALDERDSAPFVPRSVVLETAFTWGDDRRPRVPWSRTLVYECHVKSLTARHPDVPAALRGTYLGLASEPVLEHLLSLGVTAVELMPIHAAVSERFLVDRGLVNHWGYNTLGWFAPDARFATGDRGEQVGEFKTMVKRLHRAGLEVILDVVYNHSAEGNHLGPCLSLRGIDNRSYYHLADDPRYLADYTGCGNALNASGTAGMRLVMDSLRYWVEEMHVDGFRFDLAPTLGRGSRPEDPFGLFFDVIRQDPVLTDAKLIAEPWDLGPDGYRLGRFPDGWAEWNGAYRDNVRRFWRGDRGQVAELASRLSGSSDLYDRGPNGSINFVTSHDGFTLHDLVTYESKHNEANGEGNRDGHDDNASRNWGHEGETDNETIVALRERMKRNFLATLLVSQGVPMLASGDELGRTQRGNNNAYCHDDETTWLDWRLDARRRALLDFTRRVTAVHRENPALRRRSFFSGSVSERGLKDVTWVRRDGHEMTEADWSRADNHVLGMLLDGAATDETDERGVPLTGDTLLVVLNGGGRGVRFRLPHVEGPGGWTELLHTHSPEASPRAMPSHRRALAVSPHTLILLAHGAPS